MSKWAERIVELACAQVDLRRRWDKSEPGKERARLNREAGNLDAMMAAAVDAYQAETETGVA